VVKNVCNYKPICWFLYKAIDWSSVSSLYWHHMWWKATCCTRNPPGLHSLRYLSAFK
jgi:hypothetical protein